MPLRPCGKGTFEFGLSCRRRRQSPGYREADLETLVPAPSAPCWRGVPWIGAREGAVVVTNGVFGAEVIPQSPYTLARTDGLPSNETVRRTPRALAERA